MKILVTTSTLPISDEDKVPAFVKDQVIALKKNYPNTEFLIQAPHNSYSDTSNAQQDNKYYREIRFHYFWPFRWELLTGRGILPALESNKLLYGQLPFLFIGQFLSMLRTVRREKPDLIYAHWFTPQAINAAFVSVVTRIPFVFTTHASDVSVLKRIPLSRALVRWICKRASAYTAVSNRTADKLVYFFDKKDWERNFFPKLSILPMGVSINSPEINNDDVAKIKSELNIPDNKHYVLYLGRLAEIKGVKYLLRGFSQLPKTTADNLHLIIAGDGQLKDSLEAEAASLGLSNVTFAGYVNGKVKDALILISEYMCIPSITDASGNTEGLPVVLMEGLAAGKIVLASDASGVGLILDEGKSGFIFNEKSSSAIKDSLLRAMGLNPKQKKSMESEAKKLASQFDIESLSTKYAKILGVT